MARTRESEIVSFDADAVLAAARDAVGDELHACTEYDTEDFRVLYAEDWLLAAVGGEAEFEDIAAKFHSYINIDFTERRLFEDISKNAGEVNAYVTRMDKVAYVRYLFDDEGLFFTMAPDTHFAALTDAVESVTDR